MFSTNRTVLFAFFLLFSIAANAFAKSDKVRVIWQEDPARQATIGWTPPETSAHGSDNHNLQQHQ